MARLTPHAFDDYLRHECAEPFADGSMCPGCREHPTKYKLSKPGHNEAPICECCLRHFHGHDVAEELTARALLGGAVKAALDACIPVGLIRAVVDDAIDEDFEREICAAHSAASRAS